MMQFPLTPDHAARLLLLAALRVRRGLSGRVLHGEHDQKTHGHRDQDSREYQPRREPEYYGKAVGGVSQSAHQFITDWQDSPTAVPTPAIIEELKQYRPEQSVLLYRGTGKTNAPLRSWTYSRDIAEGFVEPGEKVISRRWYPDEILLDFSRLPKTYQEDLDKHGMGTSLQEVIVRYKVRERHQRDATRTLGGQGSGNFGHAGRPGERGGSAPGRGYSEEDYAQPFSEKGIRQTEKPITLYHSSPSDKPPAFDAFFGGEEFIHTFSPTEFGEHRYSMVLPKGTRILDLNEDTPAARVFKAEIVRYAWPEDKAFYDEVRKGKGDEDAVYEAWTDKRNITNALVDYQPMVVRYQDEYLIPKTILSKVKIRTLEDFRYLHLPGQHEQKTHGHGGDGIERQSSKTKILSKAASTATVFHGTYADVVDKIKTEGIKPHASAGGDAWGLKHFGMTPEEYYGMNEAQIADRRARVFVTTEEVTADKFAEIAAEMHPGSKPVILKIKVPREQLEPDPASGETMGALTFKGTIPPEWIQAIEPAHIDPHRRFRPPGSSRFGAADDGKLLYLVLLIDDDEQPRALGDKPGHEFHGNQWTTGQRSWGHQDWTPETVISWYQQHGHLTINHHLRGESHFVGQTRKDADQAVQAMDAAFKHGKTLKESRTVYRGIAADQKVFDKLSRIKTGQIIADKAYLSTSTSEKTAVAVGQAIADRATLLTPGASWNRTERRVVFTIQLPKGQRYLSGRRDEKEMILPRSMKMKVVKVEKARDAKSGSGYLYVTAKAM